MDTIRDHEHAAELADALQARLRKITFPVEASVERELRRCVNDYADQLKTLGLPPERVVIAMKRLVSGAGVVATSRSVATPKELDGRDKLLVDIVAWCIEQYYRRPKRAG